MPYDFNYGILDVAAHRPWAMPRGPWLMTQTWHDLLFAHWPLPPDRLRPLIPRDCTLDVFDGAAWVGIVPFSMTNVAPRAVPALPWLSEFPELNVRTYVSAAGKPGVYFFSLDAARWLAVRAARLLLRLPYFCASMRVSRHGASVSYASRRRSGARPAVLRGEYRPVGPIFRPAPHSLEYFLTERYCLYERNHLGRLYRLDIHHPPWPLQLAECELRENSMAEAAGLNLPAQAPLLLFAKRQDMVAWAPTP